MPVSLLRRALQGPLFFHTRLPAVLLLGILLSSGQPAHADCSEGDTCSNASADSGDTLNGIPLELTGEPEDLGDDNTDVDDSDTDNTVDDTAIITPVGTYLPPQKMKSGTYRVACVGIKWLNYDRPAASAQQCRSLVSALNRYYSKNSRGKVTLLSAGGFTHEAGLNANGKNLRKVEAEIRQLYRADLHVIPSIITYPHANNRIAHVKSASFMTAAHEMGHLLGQAHSGAYLYNRDGTPQRNKDGRYVFLSYGDDSSIMGRVLSGYLTPPQYWRVGWLPKDEYAIYNPATPTYELKRLNEVDRKGVSTVIIPSVEKGGHSIFVSVSRRRGHDLVSVHLSRGTDSRRVIRFGGDAYDDVYFTGLKLRVLERTPQSVRITIEQGPVLPGYGI